MKIDGKGKVVLKTLKVKQSSLDLMKYKVQHVRAFESGEWQYRSSFKMYNQVLSRSEVSLTKKTNTVCSQLYVESKTGKLLGIESKIMVSRGW